MVMPTTQWMDCDGMLTIRVEQRRIKSHLEWGQRVIGRLSFEAHRVDFDIEHPEELERSGEGTRRSQAQGNYR